MAHEGGYHFPSANGTRPAVVGEYGCGTNEDLVGELYTTKHRHVVLYFDTITDLDSLIHKDVLPQSAIDPDMSTGSNVDVMPDPRADAHGSSNLHNGCLVDQRITIARGRVLTHTWKGTLSRGQNSQNHSEFAWPFRLCQR